MQSVGSQAFSKVINTTGVLLDHLEQFNRNRNRGKPLPVVVWTREVVQQPRAPLAGGPRRTGPVLTPGMGAARAGPVQVLTPEAVVQRVSSFAIFCSHPP